MPIGFGPWGNFRMAWGNPVCHWDGVTSGVPGVRNNVRPVQEMFSQRCHAEMIFLLYLLAFKRIAAHQQNAMISTISRS